ncbi:HK97 family phage portal protein [Aquamicrobium terrae]
MAWTWPRFGGKAGARPPERKTAPSGFIAFHAQGEANWTRRDYATLAREGFMRNPIVHRSVRLIAETASAIPWLLYEGAAEIEAHPLLDLLERPNPRQAGATFFEALYGHLLLAGNAYVELIDAGDGARELHLLRPDRVSVETDASGWPCALQHREGSARRSVLLGSAQGGGAAHLTLFHPLDDHYGFPPLEAALMALDTHNAAGRWNKALLDNSARPSGALVYAPKEGGNLTDEQFERLKSELEDGYSGATRAGRPLLLEGGLDWKAMALSPKDMDFIEAKHSASRDIALAFGVPPMLLGIPGDNTYANYQEANRAFYRLTVLPLVARIAKELSAWLGAAFGGGLRLWYDADRIDALSGERDALWARLEAAGFLTEDEKREAVGYAPGGLGTKDGFRPDLPRVPAGNPDGGQWTGGGGAQGGWLQYQPVGSDDRN